MEIQNHFEIKEYKGKERKGEREKERERDGGRGRAIEREREKIYFKTMVGKTQKYLHNDKMTLINRSRHRRVQKLENKVNNLIT